MEMTQIFPAQTEPSNEMRTVLHIVKKTSIHLMNRQSVRNLSHIAESSIHV